MLYTVPEVSSEVCKKRAPSAAQTLPIYMLTHPSLRTDVARLIGHTPRKLPAFPRQPLASSHIKPSYYSVFVLKLQSLCLFLVYRFFTNFRHHFCLYCTKQEFRAYFKAGFHNCSNDTFVEYIAKTDAVLKNHYDALIELCEKHGMVDSNTNDGSNITPK